MALDQLFGQYRNGASEESCPGQQTSRRRISQTDHATQFRQFGIHQLTRGTTGQLRYQLHEHGVIVAALEGTGTNQPGAAGLAQGVFQLAETVCRINVDQNGTDFGTGKLSDTPFGTVRRPNADTVTRFHTQSQ
ncbi:hypothetical protein D3C87_1518640 [compost metagenome]